MTHAPSKAFLTSLKEATEQLCEVERLIERLEKERASLQQIVAVLQTQVGNVELEHPKTLTDAILLVVKGAPGCITAADVLSRLGHMGIAASARSVATILSRLTKERRIDSWLDQPNGSLVGYEWRGPRTKSDMLTANKAVAEMGRRGGETANS